MSVLLVHGTFARRAPWTRPESRFAAYVTQAFGACSIDTLLWSGDNSHSEREAAACLAQDWIEQNDAPYIYLIGHSHGGGVAAMGASRAARKDVHVITLSTPFLHFEPRYASFASTPDEFSTETDKVRLMILIETFLLLLAGYFVIPQDWLYDAFIVIVVVWQVYANTLFKERSRAILVKRIENIRKSTVSFAKHTEVTLDPSQLLVLRTTNDEASFLLALSAFSSWILQTLVRFIQTIFQLTRRLEKLVAEYFNPMFIVSVLMLVCLGFLKQSETYASLGNDVLEHFGNALSMLLFIAYAVKVRAMALVVEALSFILTAPLFMLVALPFGLETALRASVLRISAEAAPPGTWTITTLRAQNALLSHSEIYERQEIAAALASVHENLLQAIPGAD
ncbi:hypothetical protein RS694_03910 [Rhodoferax saidenbachensis]|uniref:AB hydrolase-1 domain-containing protein n=1 Tax=Rhodoferax saidenbachensis TaxID=1484693 RepID=A0A1P8K6Z7_9BURK|nr:hypothetical protein RS694_03910 [Rhodoferax saidenbachensis]